MLTQVCQNLNEKLSTHVNKLISDYCYEPHKIEEFNVEEFITTLDPAIWKAICLITQSSSKSDTHVKTIRRVYARGGTKQLTFANQVANEGLCCFRINTVNYEANVFHRSLLRLILCTLLSM